MLLKKNKDNDIMIFCKIMKYAKYAPVSAFLLYGFIQVWNIDKGVVIFSWWFILILFEL